MWLKQHGSLVSQALQDLALGSNLGEAGSKGQNLEGRTFMTKRQNQIAKNDNMAKLLQN